MAATLTLHATTVAHRGRAIVITGAAGSGKSGLALSLMAHGCTLIADDRTVLTATATGLTASCPPAIRGLIEARGIGILNATPHAPAPVALVIDLDTPETDRLPPRRSVTYLDRAIPLILRPTHRHFEAAVLHYVSAGRSDG